MNRLSIPVPVKDCCTSMFLREERERMWIIEHKKKSMCKLCNSKDVGFARR